MKIQDIAFFLVLALLIILRKPRLTVVAGMIFILLSMPLFYLKTALFTAERLTIYAAILFLTTIIQNQLFLRKS